MRPYRTSSTTGAYTLCNKPTIGPDDIHLTEMDLEDIPLSGHLDALDEEVMAKKKKLVLDTIRRLRSIPKAATALGKERTTLHSIISRRGIRTQVDLLLHGR